MSTQEIIAELTKLTPAELQQIRARVDELIARKTPSQKSVWDVFKESAGTVEGLPSDFAENHDHYLYGTPKKSP